MKNKKVLITGGAGFIGSHLCESLIDAGGHDVVSLDNYFTGSKKNHISGVEYVEGSTKDIEKIINFAPDIIFHLGEYSRVEQSFDDINIIYEYNKLGTFAVLEFWRRHSCKLIYAGSSTKFGDEGLGRDQSPYAWAKATNTDLVKNYGRWFELDYAITYFYNAYGPRELSDGKYASVVGKFHRLSLEGKPLPIVSPGVQRRNFTHVKDIVSGLMLVAAKGLGDGYGIGSDEDFSILELSELFDSEIAMLPERKGNRMTAAVKNEQVKSLGWKTTMSLRNYIDDLKRNNKSG